MSKRAWTAVAVFITVVVVVFVIGLGLVALLRVNGGIGPGMMARRVPLVLPRIGLRWNMPGMRGWGGRLGSPRLLLGELCMIALLCLVPLLGLALLIAGIVWFVGRGHGSTPPAQQH